MYYIIYDLQSKSYLYDKNGNLVCCDTLMDCFDYVEYIMKRDDFDNFKFSLYF